jgi:hypothetical protein
MTNTTSSTRRLFLAGAALSAPAAVATAAAARPVDETAERLARLEDLNAVRTLKDSYLRRVNARAGDEIAALYVEPKKAALDETVCSLVADAAGEPETIELAEDRASAVVQAACTAETETPIEGDGTLVEMARLQGDGVVRSAERRVLEIAAVKIDGAWKIARAELRPA